jgi:hypothetical protein
MIDHDDDQSAGRSRMNSPASVDGRDLTGPYRNA